MAADIALQPSTGGRIACGLGLRLPPAASPLAEARPCKRKRLSESLDDPACNSRLALTQRAATKAGRSDAFSWRYEGDEPIGALVDGVWFDKAELMLQVLGKRERE